MIKVNTRFSIDADKFCFHVVEYGEGKTREGAPKITERRTYHPNLEQCLNHIRQQECKDCADVDELLAVLKKSYVLDRNAVFGLLSASKRRQAA